jgi:hypothetical protein
MHGLLLLALSLAASEPASAPAATAEPSLSLAGLLEAPVEPRWTRQGGWNEGEYEVDTTTPIGRQRNHLSAFLATRVLEDSAWEPVDKPLAAGLSFDTNTGGWFNWDVAFFFATDDESRDVGGSTESIDIDSYELSLGLLKIFDTRFIRPYLGFGGAWVYVEGRVAEGLTISTGSDSVFGGYVRGGLLWPVHNGYVGLDLRAAQFADVQVGDRELGYAYGQAALVFGYGF